jgi:hypothetical protein
MFYLFRRLICALRGHDPKRFKHVVYVDLGTHVPELKVCARCGSLVRADTGEVFWPPLLGSEP